MKKKEVKISANEVNRFMYCSYQWYYTRTYGQKVLREKHAALYKNAHASESHLRKGLHFHKQYYQQYHRRKVIEMVILFIFIMLGIGTLLRWFI